MKGSISWYPGHIKVAEEELKQKWLPLIDLIIQVVDSRIPLSGIYPNQALFRNKICISVFTKKDITNKEVIKKLVNPSDLIVNSHKPHEWRNKLKQKIKVYSENIMQKLQEQGRKRNLRIGICGLPNVGKSTFLNNFAGIGKKAKTGDQPGITRQMQFIRGEDFDLLDTPGIMPFSLEQTLSYKLVLCGLLPAKLFDEEDLIKYIQDNYSEIYEKIKDNLGEKAWLKNFQTGKLGKFCLD